MTTRKKRPRTVTITLLGVILIGIWSAAQALAMARQIDLYLTLGVKPDPRLLLVFSAAWAVLFLGSAIALFRRISFARWLIPLLIFLYALYELLLQGMFVQAPITLQNWLFRFLLFDVTVLFALWSLNRSAARSYFAAPQSAPAAE